MSEFLALNAGTSSPSRNFVPEIRLAISPGRDFMPEIQGKVSRGRDRFKMLFSYSEQVLGEERTEAENVTGQ